VMAEDTDRAVTNIGKDVRWEGTEEG
jgi:hypothetical protein